ncbi:hypothetical protein KL86DYS1_31471 [uncultured Dysgonomonas sp.]|uniref:Uncharacterized protein n=1 Tax=uncultured Dysgonomonas sp. TaxID=206096 RepID=A0A212K4W6_9BACT|nr:hypothetical protein KL86DYS1_31471 [uncultured Dysgonomonas sp.]
MGYYQSGPFFYLFLKIGSNEEENYIKVIPVHIINNILYTCLFAGQDRKNTSVGRTFCQTG